MTQDIKEIYSSNKDIRVYEALEISNPYFSQTYYFVNDTESHDFDTNNGIETFIPMPFSLVLPEKGSNQQDLQLTLPSFGDVSFVKELNAALQDVFTPIKLRYLVYIEGSQDIQTEIPNLEFTNIVVDKNTVTGVGVRKDLYGYYILDKAIFDDRFEGLWL